MRKFILALAVIAVLVTAGFAVVLTYRRHQMQSDPTAQTSSVRTFSVSTYSTTTAGSSTQQNTDSTTSSSAGTTSAQQQTFRAQIQSVNGRQLLVAPDQDSAEARSAKKISADCANAKIIDDAGKTVRDDDIENFTQAEITYDGQLRETSPVQVSASEAVLSHRTHCNVYFYVNDELVMTRRVPVGGTLEAADMPNGGAYCADGTRFEGWQSGNQTYEVLEQITDSVVLTAKITRS